MRPVDLLRRVTGLDADMLDPVLARLCAGGFLVEIGAPSTAPVASRAYGFRHGLIRETAYTGILLRSPVRMHAAVLAALEERGGDDEARRRRLRHRAAGRDRAAPRRDGSRTHAIPRWPRCGLGARLGPPATCIRQRLDDPANGAHPWLDGVALAP